MIFDRLLNTLGYIVRQEEKVWRRNPVRQHYKFGRLQNIVVKLSQYPLKWVFSAFLLNTILSVSVFYYADKSAYISDVLINYFTGIWIVQTSVAALVYPIVIAFVALLLQRRHNVKSFLFIYLRHSSAIVSGMSALFLLVMMAAHYLLLPHVDYKVGVAWIYMDGIWLIINLGLTAYFLYQTFEFIGPLKRLNIVKRYAINVILPKEISKYIARYYYQSAVEHQFLPGPSSSSKEAKDSPSIDISGIRIFEKHAETAVVLAEDSVLVDVRFRILKLVTQSWLKTAHDYVKNNPNITQTTKPIIQYLLTPFSKYSGRTVLCLSDENVQISKAARYLLKNSFVFKLKKYDEGLKVNDVLQDLKTESILFMRTDDEEAFADAVHNLAEFYILFINASNENYSGEEKGNYSLLNAGSGSWISHPLHQKWGTQITDLFKISANQISKNEQYLSKIIYIPTYLFSSLDRSANSEILKEIIGYYSFIYYQLGMWWTKMADEQGFTNHDSHHVVILKPPYNGVYVSLLRKFVGYWEGIKNTYFYPRIGDKSHWLKFQEVSKYYELHLKYTARMLSDSVFRGDAAGVDWGLDMFVKWFAGKHIVLGSPYPYKEQTLYTYEMMDKSWDAVQQESKLRTEDFYHEDNPKDYFSIILKNYWQDVSCVLVYLFVTWARDGHDNCMILGRVIKSIIYGKPPAPDGHTTHEDLRLGDINEVFVAIIRQYHSQGDFRDGYRIRLSNLVRQIKSSVRDEWVSGRIYSGRGSDGLGSLLDGQLFLLLILVPENWDPREAIEWIFQEWIVNENQKLTNLLRDLESWGVRLEESDFNSYEDLFKCIHDGSSASTFKESLDKVKKGLDTAISIIHELQNKTLIDLPVSAERLEEIGRFSSSKGFESETAMFPISVFKSIKFDSDNQSDRGLIISGVNKGEYTEPAMVQPVGNEEEWFANMIRKQVATSVMADIIIKSDCSELDGSVPEKYWEQIKIYSKQAKNEDKKIMLLIENRATPLWLYNWIDPYHRNKGDMPPDLDVWKDDGINKKGYVANLNEVEVYTAPIPPGASYLVTSDLFQELVFTRYENKNYVDVEGIDLENDLLHLDLKLTWSFKVKLDNYPLVKLVYRDNSNTPEYLEDLIS